MYGYRTLRLVEPRAPAGATDPSPSLRGRASSSLEEPAVRADTLGAVVTLGHPGVVLVEHAVLLAPPVHGRHEEHKAEHPPDDGDLHAVVLLQVAHGAVRALRPPLLETVPEDQLHHLAILRAVGAAAAEDVVLRHGSLVRVRYGGERTAVAVLLGDEVPAADVLLVAGGPVVLEARGTSEQRHGWPTDVFNVCRAGRL